MTTCAFLGHRDVYQSDMAVRLEDEIEKLLQTDNEFTFLIGGMGQFDGMGTAAVQATKRRHPEKHITLTLVLPYMSNRLNTAKEYYRFYYDPIIIPWEADTARYKAAIQIRNRWSSRYRDCLPGSRFRRRFRLGQIRPKTRKAGHESGREKVKSPPSVTGIEGMRATRIVCPDCVHFA